MWDSPYEMITPLPSPFIYVVKGGGTQEGKKRVQGHRRGRTLLGGSQRLWREGGCDVEAFWHTWPPSCHSVPGWQQCSAALRKVPSDAWHRSTLKGPESGTRQLEVTQHGDSRSCCWLYTIQSGLHWLVQMFTLLMLVSARPENAWHKPQVVPWPQITLHCDTVH